MDDQIIVARNEQLQLQSEADNDGQLIILGAGYDTRGFRLVDLWNNHDSITSTTGDVTGDDGTATNRLHHHFMLSKWISQKSRKRK